MPHFKDTENKLHFLDDPAFVHLLPAGSVQITDEEADALRVATPEQIIAGYVTAMEAHYDAVAKAKGYDNRYTCALRAGYSGQFQSEGVAFAQWMDACNAYAYQELAKIQNAERTIPTVPGFISELPATPW